MRAWAGQDFRASVGTKAPLGLVSEPADYGECEQAAKKVIPRSFTGKLKIPNAQIAQKCRLLHDAIKTQALNYLISTEWTLIEGAEEGLRVSNKQLHEAFARERKLRYPTEADLRKYLSEQSLTLSDLLYQLKRSILVSRILPRFEAKVKKAGGGEKVYVKLALERYKKLIAGTRCKPGYVVTDCREYTPPPKAEPAPNTILESFVQRRVG